MWNPRHVAVHPWENTHDRGVCTGTLRPGCQVGLGCKDSEAVHLADIVRLMGEMKWISKEQDRLDPVRYGGGPWGGGEGIIDYCRS